jgi:fructose-bisphosphate aldolase class II
MFDGSHLPFVENIRQTKRVVEVAHSFGIPVEAELGQIPDATDDIHWPDLYTKVEEAEEFVSKTGVDLLAISAGVMHGITLDKPEPLAIDLVARIREATKIPLVLHGASGVPVNELKEAIAAGVHKLNADTDLRHAFRSGIEHTFSQGDRQLEEAMDEGRRRMIDATIEKMQDYGCARTATA